MKKKVSKKKIISLASLILVICIISGVTLANANKDEEFVEPIREYPVSRGDIVAGFNGAGSLKLEAKDYNFSEPVMVEEFFVKVGDAIKAGDPLAKISGEAIQKQLEDLNEQLTKANMALEQAKNAKELNILNNEKSWNQVTQSSQEQYNSEKSVVESELKKLDEQLANIQTKKHEITQKINELEVTQVQANNEAPDLEEEGTNPEILLNSDEELQQLRQQLSDLEQQEESVRAQINDAIARKNDIDWHRDKEVQKEQQEASSNKQINDKTLIEMDQSIQLASMEVEKIQKEISKVKELSENNTLVSDVDGIVTSLGYTSNTMTSTDKPVVTIGTLDMVTAVIGVSQNDVNKLEEGQVVQLEVNAYPGEKLMAKVKSINYVPSNEGGSVVYKVTVELDSTERALLEGMTVNAKFIIKEVKDVLILSNKAITLVDGKQMVKVKREDGTIEDVEITTGFSDGRVSEIKNGLSEGDIVVVGG
ncbi:HlyD family efflux transporter periplasmic adaptor subunit [Turicibacter sanguinis]|nr:HlyD family efflux transporter periplasmic adaptor subunit [Turicibacter sanguinis]